MKRRPCLLPALFALFALFCAPRPASARWAALPLEKVVADSDLIVVATLRDVKEFTRDGRDWGSGTLVVQKSVWGEARPGEKLPLHWDNDSQIACPRVEHAHNANRAAVWLLNRGDCGTVRADYPGRVLAPNEEAKVRQAFGKSFIRLSVEGYAVPLGAPALARLTYRNPTGKPLNFPGVEWRDGKLYAHPGLAFEIHWDPTLLGPLPSGLNVRPVSARSVIQVQPGAEPTVAFDAAKALGVNAAGSYRLRAEVKGYGKAETWFYAMPAKEYARRPNAARREEACSQPLRPFVPLYLCGNACPRPGPNPAAVWLLVPAVWLGWRLLSRPEIVTRFPR